MFQLNGIDGTVLFVIFIMISVLVSNFSRKAVKKNRDARLPGWYLTLRPILQGIMFLFIISYFFTHKTYLIVIGVIGLVVLDVLHSILSFAMGFLYKRQESGAAVNEQPIRPMVGQLTSNKPDDPAQVYRDITDKLAYPTFSKPANQNQNSLQPSTNIDHFSQGSNGLKLLIIFLIAGFFLAGAAIWVLSSTGGLDQFFK
jgi:energy-coupling factor transporter transmembrane protein EcfT